MLGRFEDSLTHIQAAESVEQTDEGSKLVSQVEMQFRTYRVGQSNEDRLSEKIIIKLNRCVVDMCAGQFD